MNNIDYYKILGIEKNASLDEIKSAYKEKAKLHHPDKGGNDEEMKRINIAYDILSDENKRWEYDNPPQAPFQQGPAGFQFHFGGGNPFANEINLNDILNNFHQFRFHGGFQQQGNVRSTQIISQRTRIPFMTALEGGDIMVFVPSINKTIKLAIPKGIQPNQTIQVRIANAIAGDNNQTEVILNLTVVIELPNLTDTQIKLIRKVLDERKEERVVRPEETTNTGNKTDEEAPPTTP